MTADTVPDMMPTQHHKHVRWDPTINMGHVITMLTSMAASLVFVAASWNTIDKRVVILEEARQSQRERDSERSDQLKEKIEGLKLDIRDTKDSVEQLRRDIHQIKPAR